MTAASGDSGERPDYEGRPPAGYGSPDPAYGGWTPPPAPASYPAPGVPGPGFPYPPPPPYPAPPPYPPPYGPPYSGGYPGYPVAPPTNVLAIVSLVSSVSGLLCFVGSLAGIITGVIAMGQLKRTGEKGYSLAVAGTVAGVIGLLIYLVMVAYALGG